MIAKVRREHQRRHQHQEFLDLMEQVDRLPRESDVSIHLVLDNYGTHKTPRLPRWLARRPYCHLHLTPTGFRN